MVGPADGEAANALSVNSVFQPVENGLYAALLLLKGTACRRRVVCTSNTNLVIQPLGAVLVTVAGVWTTLAHASPTTVSPVTITGGLVANTRFWVYAYNNAGTVDFVATTTAPDAALQYANGDTTKLYVSTFYCDATPNVLTYSQSDNNYSYGVRSQIGGGAGGNLSLDAGHAVSGAPATVAFGSSLPSQARNAILQVGVSGAGTYTMSIGQVGSSTTAPLSSVSGLAAAQPGFTDCKFSLIGAYSFDYFVSNAGANGYVWVAGFDL